VIGVEPDVFTLCTEAGSDAVPGSRTPSVRVTVGVTRSTDGRVVTVFHRRTSRHACAVGPEVTTFTAVLRTLSQPQSDKRFSTYHSKQGSRIRSVRILFSEIYVRTLAYSILAYINKNRIRTQTMIAETANWFFATFVINLLSDSVVQNGQFN